MSLQQFYKQYRAPLCCCATERTVKSLKYVKSLLTPPALQLIFQKKKLYEKT